jgi:hypothetical protein
MLLGAMMAVKTTLRIAINAQFEPGSNWGGVESVLIGLAKALGELHDGFADDPRTQRVK